MAIWQLNGLRQFGTKICSGDHLSLGVNAPKSDLQLRSVQVEAELKLKVKVQQEFHCDNTRKVLYNLTIDCKRLTNGFKVMNFTEDIDNTVSRACLFFTFKWNACKGDWSPRLPIRLDPMNNKPEDLTLSKIIITLEKETNDLGLTTLLNREFNIEFRRLCIEEKMRNFLLFQSRLVYGTPDTKDKYDFYEQRYVLSNQNWHLKKMKQGKIAVSSMGRDNYASVCITFVAQFLAYWHNYGRFYTRITAADSDRLTSSVKKFGSLNSNGFGDFLSPLPDEINTYKKLWPVITHESILPGDVFVSATKSHVVLLVKIGTGFSFKNKEIFGSKVNKPEDLAAHGIYLIQANGKIKLEISYAKYGKSETIGKLNKFINKYPEYKTNFENAIATFKADNSADGVFLFAGSELQQRNGSIKENEHGKLVLHYCGDVLEDEPSQYATDNMNNTARKVWFVGNIEIELSNSPYKIKSVNVIRRNINAADGLLSDECKEVIPKSMFTTDNTGTGYKKIDNQFDLFAHDCRLYECDGNWDNTSTASSLMSGGTQTTDEVIEFIKLVEELESLYPLWTGEQVLSCLRRIAWCDDLNFRVMFGGENPIPAGEIIPYSSLEERLIHFLRHNFNTSKRTETGIVQQDQSTNIRIAMSHVITGISGGFYRNENLDVPLYVANAKFDSPWYWPIKKVIYLSNIGEKIDNLYAVTIAGDLGQAANKKNEFGSKNTGYIGYTIDQPEATFAELIGDIDGFIIGNNLYDFTNGSDLGCMGGAKVSQILRNFYTNSITPKGKNNRFNIFSTEALPKLKDQTIKFAINYAYSQRKYVGGIITAIQSEAKEAFEEFNTWLSSQVDRS